MITSESEMALYRALRGVVRDAVKEEVAKRAADTADDAALDTGFVANFTDVPERLFVTREPTGPVVILRDEAWINVWALPYLSGMTFAEGEEVTVNWNVGVVIDKVSASEGGRFQQGSQGGSRGAAAARWTP